MVSYAQNAEDAVLDRVFKSFNGFYVDVGAAFPTLDSVTKHFYDKGWNGINIEPQPFIFNILNEQRPRDTNLQCAIDTKEGKTKLTTFPGLWGWATINDKYTSPEGHEKQEIEVDTRTLESVLNQYAQGIEIDFMKIDVEGHEPEVLKSFNIKRWRPKVLIVEVVTQGIDEHKSRSLNNWLMWRGYRFAMFDGLNNFYVRKDLKDIYNQIATPANCLDIYFPQRYLSYIPKEVIIERIAIKKQRGEDTSEYENYLSNVDQLNLEGNARP